MDFNPFEVSIPHIAYACLGAFVVVFGMFSLLLREKLYIGEACWAFLFGVIIGPYGANIFDPRDWGGDEDTSNVITLEFTRVVLAIGVFAIGVELPKAYMIRHWRSLLFLLVPVMTWGWFVSAGLICGLIPSLNFLSSLAVAACLTPTDPILAAAVVGGKWADEHVPAHIRHLLAAESGCNDGAAYPFLFIALYLMFDAPDVGNAIRDWFVRLWLYQIILGIIIGAVLGFAFRHLMKFCQRHNLIDRHSYVAQYISLAMLTMGVTILLGSDDLLAAFSCGTAFAWDGFFNRQTEESNFSSVIDLLFNIAAFVYVGAWMPFSAFQSKETTLTVWRLMVIAILVFILRRLPPMIVLYRWIPDIKTFREAVFSGHFGPIGIGAVFISTLAEEFITKDERLRSHQAELLAKTIQPIVAFMVLCSVVLHGLSIPSFSLGRRVHSVSRTWSRRDTLTNQPEWTNQARVVERGENIVINRDDVMERGELGVEKPEDSLSRLTSSGFRTPSVTVADVGEDGRSTHTDKLETGDQSDGESFQGAVETEWLEPHRRVIERQPSRGEDVEVEVIEDDRRSTQSLTAQIKQSLGFPHGPKQAVSELEDRAGPVVKDKAEEIEFKVKDALDTHPRHDENIAGPSHLRSDDEDGAWASTSENSGSEKDLQAGGGSSQKRTIRRQRTSFSRRSGRRRTSIRPNSLPAIEFQQSSLVSDPEKSTSTSPTPPEERESRGRSYQSSPHFAPKPHLSSVIRSNGRPLAEGSTRTSFGRHQNRRSGTADSSIVRPGTGDSSLPNARVSHIRMLHSSPPTREVSPSRSVRFMDERGNDPEVRSKVSSDIGLRSPAGSGRT
ncbi:hypothetical protein H2248_005630 [Termitomyces sp. 'cryptogamus']|nr:hypothetical protein H2248_005630 [Termitomyces sp. 'cryptogamus']